VNREFLPYRDFMNSLKAGARRDTSRRKTSSAARKVRPLQPLTERLADRLGTAIVTGVHQPGSTLPNELEASEGYKVSRTAYREALRVLTAKGLVSSRPKTGTKVSPRSQWNILDPSVLGWMFATKPDLQFVKSLYELRQIVEPPAAALAAQRRTSSELSRMGHALQEMSRHGLHTEEGREADEHFHQIILEATRNEPLSGLVATISTAIRWTTLFKYSASKKPRDPIPAHENLFAAIAAKDADAAHEAALTLVKQAFEDIRLMLEEGA
jgi:DNA-binding FadR family transcriptional regulator